MRARHWIVKKDGEVLFEGTSHGECWVWIHNHQFRPVALAMKEDGYEIAEGPLAEKEGVESVE